MLWYLLQFVIMGLVLLLYQNQDLSHQPLGYVILFGYLTAYALTWCLSRIIDGSLFLLRLIKHGLPTRRRTQSQNTGNISRVKAIRSRRLP